MAASTPPKVDASAKISDTFDEEQRKIHQEDGTFLPVLEDEVLAQLTISMDEVDRIQAILDEFGMAIVTGVVSPEKCQDLEVEIGKDLLNLIHVDQMRGTSDACDRVCDLLEAHKEGKGEEEDRNFHCNLVRTWPSGSQVGRGPFAIDYGVPQGRFAWECRTQENIRKVYEEIHKLKPEDLCVSLDTVFFTPPSFPLRTHSKALWPHVDQNLHAKPSGDWEIYQSILYVWGSDTDGASTTIVWPKSQKEIFRTIMEDPSIKEAGDTVEHYSPISAMKNRPVAEKLDQSFIQNGRRIPMPQGSLLVWSSRTVHQGHGGGRRLAMPICWEPKERRESEALRRKARLCTLGMASTHWASLGYQHGLNNLEPHTTKPSSPETLKRWAECLLSAHQKGGETSLLNLTEASAQSVRHNDVSIPFYLRLPTLGCEDPHSKKEETKDLQKKIWKNSSTDFISIDKDPAYDAPLFAFLKSEYHSLL